MKILSLPLQTGLSALAVERDGRLHFLDAFLGDVEELAARDVIEPLFAHALETAPHEHLQPVELPSSVVESIRLPSPTARTFFDEISGEFRHEDGDTSRVATNEESRAYVQEVCTRAGTRYAEDSASELEIRLIEASMGFIPGFEKGVEFLYRSLVGHDEETTLDEKPWPRRERERVFGRLFTKQILPFARAHGFERVTKSGKSLVEPLDNGLSLALIIGHSSFGSGAYAFRPVYFDEDYGSVADDEYLFHTQDYFPYSTNHMIRSSSEELLLRDIEYWMQVMDVYLLPFVDRHRNHRQLLDRIEKTKEIERIRREMNFNKWSPAYTFRTAGAHRDQAIFELLRRKARAGSA